MAEIPALPSAERQRHAFKDLFIASLRRSCYAIAYVTYYAARLYENIMVGLLRVRSSQTEDVESNRFTYPPIHQKSFWKTTRLLRLAPGSALEPLEGNLLSNATISILFWSWTFGVQEYDAISYCWGDSTKTKMIHLDGKLLPITENLHGALQRLRHPESPRMVWADQICINQSESAFDERNQQVQRMGEIYANATAVIMWLGNATSASNIIFGGLSQVDDQTAEFQGMYRKSELLPGHSIFESIRHELLDSMCKVTDAQDESKLLELLGTALNMVLQNPWFERIWVLQEAALASDLILQAGTKSVSWMRFMGCARVLEHILGPKTFMSRNAVGLYDIEMLRHQWYGAEGPDISFLRMVANFRARQATDPRDKVYGLLGLSVPSSKPMMPAGGKKANKKSTSRDVFSLHRSGFPLSSDIMFHADYSKSPEEAFTDFAFWCIQRQGDLEVLANCCYEDIPPKADMDNTHQPYSRYATRYPHITKKVPSWVTDWSLDAPGDCGDLVGDSLLPGRQPYQASLHHRAEPRLVFRDDTSSPSPSSHRH